MSWQKDDIENLASQLGIESGGSSSQYERLEKISKSVGMDSFNGISNADADELERRLIQLKKENELGQNQLQQLTQLSNALNSQKDNNFLANSKKISSAPANNKSMKEKLQKKAGAAALQYFGLPKDAANKAMDFAQTKEGKKMVKSLNQPQLGKAGNVLNKLLGFGDKKTTTEAGEGGEYESFTLSLKFIKLGLMFCAAFAPILIFCCLFISASQVFLNAISLGTADSLSGPDVESKINKKGTDGLDEEKSDDDVAYDIYIDDSNSISFRNNKLNNFKVLQVAKKNTYLKRKYNEASLDNIEDFYPAIEDLSKNYDKNMVYDFFFKMYNLYTSYRDNYDVQLDLPLLMATLNLQSTDKNVIFEANLSDVDRQKTARQLPIEEFDFYYDWTKSGYKISRNDSEHDMELLAQNMVCHQIKEKCVNAEGQVTQEKVSKDKLVDDPTIACAEEETYEVEDLGYFIDNDKYKEFLRQFLEKKYYLEGEYAVEDLELPENDPTIDGESSGNPSTNNTYPASGDFRTWTQCGQSWSSITVPKSSKTMCSIGCLITSVTIQIARSGTAITTDTIDPGIAVKKYNFANGGNFYWHSTTNIAPNFTYLTNISLLGMNKKSIADKLTSYDSSRYYIILAVSKKDRNKVHHYVALDYVDKSDNKIYIMDPAGVAYTDLYDIYKVYTAHIYEKKD